MSASGVTPGHSRTYKALRRRVNLGSSNAPVMEKCCRSLIFLLVAGLSAAEVGPPAVRADFYASDDFSDYLETRPIHQVNFEDSASFPAELNDAGRCYQSHKKYSVVIRAQVRVPMNQSIAELKVETNSRLLVEVDGEEVLSRSETRGAAQVLVADWQPGSVHSVRIESDKGNRSEKSLRLLWRLESRSAFEVIPPDAFQPPDAGGVRNDGKGLRLRVFSSGVMRREQTPAALPEGGSGLTSEDLSLGVFNARYEGYIEPPATGTYTFSLINDDGGAIAIGDMVLLDDMRVSEKVTEFRREIFLYGGTLYPIDVLARQVDGEFPFTLRWQVPGESPGPIPVSACYARGSGKGFVEMRFDDRGYSTLLSVDLVGPIDFDFGDQGLRKDAHRSHVSASWEGRLFPPAAGHYRLVAGKQADQIDLWVNGQKVAEDDRSRLNWVAFDLGYVEQGQPLDIRIGFQDKWGNRHFQLKWSCDGLMEELIPLSQLYPPVPKEAMLSAIDSSGEFGTRWDEEGNFSSYVNPAWVELEIPSIFRMRDVDLKVDQSLSPLVTAASAFALNENSSPGLMGVVLPETGTRSIWSEVTLADTGSTWIGHGKWEALDVFSCPEELTIRAGSQLKLAGFHYGSEIRIDPFGDSVSAFSVSMGVPVVVSYPEAGAYLIKGRSDSGYERAIRLNVVTVHSSTRTVCELGYTRHKALEVAPANNSESFHVSSEDTASLQVKMADPGDGLLAQYFDGMEFEELRMMTVDPWVDFEWPGSGPGPHGMENDSFSVRWSGELLIPTEDTVTFKLSGLDGVRFYLDGDLLADTWDTGQPYHPQIAVQKAAGRYSIRLEYLQNRGTGRVALRWQWDGREKETVPTRYLFSSPGEERALNVSVEPLGWGAGKYFIRLNAEDGPVVFSQEVQEFDIVSHSRRKIAVEEVTEDGIMILDASLSMTPGIDGLRYDFSTSSHSVINEGGQRWWTAWTPENFKTDSNEGVYLYDYRLYAPEEFGKTCHGWKVYDKDVRVSK